MKIDEFVKVHCISFLKPDQYLTTSYPIKSTQIIVILRDFLQPKDLPLTSTLSNNWQIIANNMPLSKITFYTPIIGMQSVRF